MKIDSSLPVFDLASTLYRRAPELQAENHELIQAVHSVNESAVVGESNELTFSLDRFTKRPIIKLVNRQTQEVVQTIPGEEVLRLAKYFKEVYSKS